MPLSWKGMTTATFQASASIARVTKIVGTGQSATRSNRMATLPGTARRMPDAVPACGTAGQTLHLPALPAARNHRTR
ncbi:hypothetical protein [Burkholderia sp. JKS000303]|uniref:hypothetical protein n=1 Tax=Burkholderia sp. JKS000303 TaxID=1938747 RepID=UPI00117E9A08|nr:hypothetical protein [Burkholderia sp. JKS000303]